MTRRLYGNADGLTGHALYPAWNGMMRRCYDKDDSAYKNYGGRGIIVCPAWHFLTDYIAWNVSQGWVEGDGLECDRRDNDGSYFPNNCRRVTCEVQAKNRRDYKECEIKKDNKSGYKYIYWNESHQQYTVRVKHVHYGYFDTLEEAVIRRDYILSLPSDEEFAATKVADQLELDRICQKWSKV